jgi:hypothetical protein
MFLIDINLLSKFSSNVYIAKEALKAHKSYIFMNILQALVQKRVTAICTFCKLLIRKEKKNSALLNNDIQDFLLHFCC